VASLHFPKSARLTRAGEFQKLKRKGVSFRGNFMVLSVLAMPESVFRIGIITSRRVGNAVTRNRVRRRLREIVRTDRAVAGSGYWCVLIVRQRATTATFAQLRDEWRFLARRAGLLLSPA
jgi:ribonuclease P protein component